MAFFMKGGLDDLGFVAYRIEVERALFMPPGSMNEEELPRSWFAQRTTSGRARVPIETLGRPRAPRLRRV